MTTCRAASRSSDTWIRRAYRHRAAPHRRPGAEPTSDPRNRGLSRQALVRAGIDPVDIDLVVCATSTPDRTFPATGVRIQHGLGISKGAAFDVQAVCSGFVYALAIADNFLKAGQFKRAIVVGAETLLAHSRLDGPRHLRAVRRRRRRGRAGGAVAARQPRRPRHPLHPHLLRRALRGAALRRRWAWLHQDHRPSAHERPRGFRHAVQKISRRCRGDPGDGAGYVLPEAKGRSRYVPHQANKRILDGIADRLHIPPDKIVFTLAKHGNTSAASIPLCPQSGGRGPPPGRGTAGADGGHGRRPDMGCRAGALVEVHSVRFKCAISAGCC